MTGSEALLLLLFPAALIGALLGQYALIGCVLLWERATRAWYGRHSRPVALSMTNADDLLKQLYVESVYEQMRGRP